MAAVTIRNLPDAVHRAIKVRAAQHNRSAEAEMRAILEEAVRPEGRVGMGTLMAEIARSHGVTNEDVDAMMQAIEEERARIRREPEPISFE